METLGIIVACRRPGLIRGGMRNPEVARHEIGTLTAEQLAELVTEPAITVVLGSVVTAEDVARFANVSEVVIAGPASAEELEALRPDCFTAFPGMLAELPPKPAERPLPAEEELPEPPSADDASSGDDPPGKDEIAEDPPREDASKAEMQQGAKPRGRRAPKAQG